MAIKKVFVAGHKGMVGSAILRSLSDQGSVELITCDKTDLDLTDQDAVEDFFQSKSFDEVYVAAAKVGGIFANSAFPAEFIYQNLMLELNIIHSAYRSGVGKLLFLGSSCIYPKLAAQPIVEEELLSGKLEPTNEAYAIAKIAGIKICESYNRQYDLDYRCVMPTNLYGPGDNYHPENSHVIPGLIRRFHEAKLASENEVLVWGTGNPRREFLHVDDLAIACVHVMNMGKLEYDQLTHQNPIHLNVGTGTDVSIRELAEIIQEVVGFRGRLAFDTSKPDGTPRKLLDISRIRESGWMPKIGLKEGLEKTYRDFLKSGELRV